MKSAQLAPTQQAASEEYGRPSACVCVCVFALRLTSLFLVTTLQLVVCECEKRRPDCALLARFESGPRRARMPLDTTINTSPLPSRRATQPKQFSTRSCYVTLATTWHLSLLISLSLSFPFFPFLSFFLSLPLCLTHSLARLSTRRSAREERSTRACAPQIVI